MKKFIYTVIMLTAIGFSYAQLERKSSGILLNDETASITGKFQNEPDIKAVDAVKFQDYGRSSPKPKYASKTKDTTKLKKRAQE